MPRDWTALLDSIGDEVTRTGPSDPEFACQHGQRLLSKWLAAHPGERPDDPVALRARLDARILDALARMPPAPPPATRRPRPAPPPRLDEPEIAALVGAAFETTMDGSDARRRFLARRAMADIDRRLREIRAGPVMRWRVRRIARRLIRDL